LRSDALLAVVFVSDADDCSAPPTTDLFDATATQYGPLTHFRCTQFGIECNGAPVPPMAVAGLVGCWPQTMAGGGKLIDIQKYIDFFTKPAAQGGVKVDPYNVIFAGMTAPSDPVGVHVESPCSDDASASECAVLNRSCISTTNTLFAGDPAVRLNAVVHAPHSNEQTSICDSDDNYPLRVLGEQIARQTSAGCLGVAVATRADGTPDCTAIDVTANPDGSVTTAPIPSCSFSAPPCWRAVDHLAEYDAEGCTPRPQLPPVTCTLPSTCQPVVNPTDGMRQLYTIVVDRGGAATPANTYPYISCNAP